MNSFSIKTGLWTLAVYTIILSLLAFARGSAGNTDFLQRVVLVALSGFLVGYFLDPLVRAIKGTFWKRFGILALIIFGLASVSNILETILYLPAVAIVGTFGGGIVQTIILAVTLIRITKPTSNDEKFKKITIAKSKIFLFILVLAVLWIPTYFLFETLDTPIVHWLEHNSGDVFSHPPLAIMLALEFMRGIIHSTILLGIALLASGRQKLTWLWGSLTLAILNGWLPILPVSTLPFAIRIANGIEITLSSVLFAGFASYLFQLLFR